MKIRIHKISGGVSLMEPIMVMAVIMMIVIGCVIFYDSRTKQVDESLMDIVSLSNSLSSSKSSESLILNYDKIVPFQEDLLKKMDCYTQKCTPFDINKYPANTYLKLDYKDNKLVSFSLYTKDKYSIFDFDTTPYIKWTKRRPLADYLNNQIKISTSKYNLKQKDNIVLSNLSEHISVYTIMDNNPTVKQYLPCKTDDCTNVLTYRY